MFINSKIFANAQLQDTGIDILLFQDEFNSLNYGAKTQPELNKNIISE